MAVPKGHFVSLRCTRQASVLLCAFSYEGVGGRMLAYFCMRCTCIESIESTGLGTGLPLLLPGCAMVDAGLALCYAVSSCISYIAL